jgi:hypothetical protein
MAPAKTGLPRHAAKAGVWWHDTWWRVVDWRAGMTMIACCARCGRCSLCGGAGGAAA